MLCSCLMLQSSAWLVQMITSVPTVLPSHFPCTSMKKNNTAQHHYSKCDTLILCTYPNWLSAGNAVIYRLTLAKNKFASSNVCSSGPWLSTVPQQWQVPELRTVAPDSEMLFTQGFGRLLMCNFYSRSHCCSTLWELPPLFTFPASP